MGHVKPLPRARARFQPHAMNKTEAAFAAELRARLSMKYIVWFAFEPMKLRLGHNTHFTPDFMVVTDAGEVVFYETKGFMREDAAVKLKVAASLFPMFRFVLVRKGKRGGPTWDCTEIKAHHALTGDAA